jgi:hypothetical protein
MGWEVASGAGGSAAGGGGGRAGEPDSLSGACAICTGLGGTPVVTTKGLVVPVELVSISAAGAAANPVVGFGIVVVRADVVVDVAVVALSESTDTAAILGTAVHRRPWMVVRKAPEGRPFDAIFRSQFLLRWSKYAKPVAPNEEKEGNKNTSIKGARENGI